MRAAAGERSLILSERQGFEAVPGFGVRAQVGGFSVAIGNERLVTGFATWPQVVDLQAQGKTLLYVESNGQPTDILAAADTLRSKVPEARRALSSLGIRKIELITGDDERTASSLAHDLSSDGGADRIQS